MDEFQKITEKMHQIYLKKNKDYGSSFDRQYDKYGMTSVLIRLSDKLNRLEQITRAGTIEVKDESVDDTLLDLANYAILALIKRQKGKVDSGDAAFVEASEPHKVEKEEPEYAIVEPDTADDWKTLFLDGEVSGIVKPEPSLSVCCDGNVVKGISTIKEDIKKECAEEPEQKKPETKNEEGPKKGDENPKWKDDKDCKTSVSMWVDEGNGLKEVDPERYPISSFLEDIIDKVFATPSWNDRIYS